MVAVADTIERSDAVVITGNRLAVDDAGARAQAGRRLDDQRETIGEVIAGTAVNPHLCGFLAGDNAKPIVLDLVQPFAS
jgi:glucose-6-phosphate dehydrogenase assembly protein OpcA